MENYFNEGVRLRFYQPNVNKRGWGSIYAFFQIGETKVRISTQHKARADYFKKGNIVIPTTATLTDGLLHKRVSDMLKNIANSVDSLIYDYLCNEDDSNIEDVITKIKDTISPMRRKKEYIPQSLLVMMKGVVMDMKNPKSVRSNLGKVGNFETFIKTKGIEDTPRSLTMSTVRKYRDYLVNETKLSAARGMQCLSYIFTLATKIERKYEGYDFKLNAKQIEPIKELRTLDDISKNKVALTTDEIETLKALQLDGKNKIVRDLFIILCYSGVRYEDLGILLDSKNLTESDGLHYSVFISTKYKIKARVPIDNPQMFPLMGLYNEYKDTNYFKDNQNQTFNNILQKICKLANLDRVIKVSQTVSDEVKVEDKKLYDAITSHCGRHTFITNCKRYKGLDDETIIKMSGHKDTTMVSRYTNTETDDELKMLRKKIEGKDVEVTRTPNANNNYSINGIVEALSVCKYLNIEVSDISNFETIIGEIAKKQFEIIDDYGVSIEVMKSLFNLTLPIKKRIEMLNVILEKLG